MEQHPIPRQITTFEFKLIGPMTVKQFGYVLLAGVIGYLVFLAVPTPIINIICAVFVFSIGPLFAFVRPNDRPFDVFLGNLFRRLNSPTQYIYEKNNPPLHIFDSLYFEANPHIVIAHVDSKEKLAAYLSSKKNTGQPHSSHEGSHKNFIVGLFERGSSPAAPQPPQTPITNAPAPPSTTNTPATKHPFLTGVVFNNRRIPLPGILLYVKDATGKPLRILKTNPHGVFATFNPLSDGEYLVDVVDSAKNYMFDSVNIQVHAGEKHYFEFTSKNTI